MPVSAVLCSVVSDSLRPHGLYLPRLLCPWRFPKQEYWNGLPCPPPGDLPNPGIQPRSPALQVDSLPEPPGKPKKTGVGSLLLLQGVFATQGLNLGLPHCTQMLYHLSHQGSQKNYIKKIFITWITVMVLSLTLSQTSWNAKSSGP